MAVVAFRVWNFMAFEDSGWVDLRPVTLLFGRNSAGKSALVRALRVLKQSLNARSEYGPLILTSSQGTDVGDYPNMVHGHTVGSSVGFGFKCQINEMFFQQLKLDIEPEVTIRLDYGLGEDGNTRIQGVLIRSRPVPDEPKNEQSGIPVIFEADLLPEDASWWFWSDFLQEYKSAHRYNVWPHVDVRTSDTGFFPRLLVEHGGSDDREFGQDYAFVQTLLRHLSDMVTDFLSSVEYLGPNRGDPRRAYSLSKATAEIASDQSLYVLRKFAESQFSQEGRIQKRQIDQWLDAMGFGAKLQVRSSQSSSGLQEEAGVEFLLTEGDTLAVNLCDVGYGVSQVLPFLLAGVTTEQGRILIVEQPELHLHTRAQAELADIFAYLANHGVRCLIETHSETLLLSLRHRVARTALTQVEQSEGAPVIQDHIIEVTEKAFDDFAGGNTDEATNRKILGLS